MSMSTKVVEYGKGQEARMGKGSQRLVRSFLSNLCFFHRCMGLSSTFQGSGTDWAQRCVNVGLWGASRLPLQEGVDLGISPLIPSPWKVLPGGGADLGISLFQLQLLPEYNSPG